MTASVNVSQPLFWWEPAQWALTVRAVSYTHLKYAIAAFNFNNMEQMQAIISAAVECKSPVILQVSSGARKYANQTILRYMAQGAVEYAKELGLNIPIVLHLDHGDSFELCKSCIDMGFSSFTS